MTPSRAPSIRCAGSAHRGKVFRLDLRAKSGPRKVGLVEDGAAFCQICAWEITRAVGSIRPT